MANKDNPVNGRKFEELVKAILGKNLNVELTNGFILEIGINEKNKKNHSFDLGNQTKKVIIECKCHSWTNTGNVPSAKMAVWNEAMYYFSLIPDDYKKILCVRKDTRNKKNNNETLASYYFRTFNHLIPKGVEIYEIDMQTEEYTLLN